MGCSLVGWCSSILTCTILVLLTLMHMPHQVQASSSTFSMCCSSLLVSATTAKSSTYIEHILQACSKCSLVLIRQKESTTNGAVNVQPCLTPDITSKLGDTLPPALTWYQLRQVCCNLSLHIQSMFKVPLPSSELLFRLLQLLSCFVLNHVCWCSSGA